MNKILRSDQSANEHVLFSDSIIETQGYFDVEYYYKVLIGQNILYWAKDVIPQEDCKKIIKSFFNSPDRELYKVKPQIESIGRALYFAEDEWRNIYFETAQDTQEQLDRVYTEANVPNYCKNLVNNIQFELKDIKTRSIMHNNKLGIFGILRSWGAYELDDEGRATRIHEDRLQLLRHKGLETFDTFNNPFTSTCLYYSNGDKGGELNLYNLKLDESHFLLEELEGEYKYGFNNSIIDNINKITIRPEAGDIITFRADYLHSVESFDGENRVNAAFFSALKSCKKVNLIWS